MPNTQVPPNLSYRRAGLYLAILGVLSLLTFNLAGLLLLWFAAGVVDGKERFRKATLWLLGLMLAVALSLLLWVTLAGTAWINMDLSFVRLKSPPLWAVYAFCIAYTVLYGLPFYWLLYPRTRSP